MKQYKKIICILALFIVSTCANNVASNTSVPFPPDDNSAGDEFITPYTSNPRYWAYGGEPVILLGGSKDDNLFQIDDLKNHLDRMQEIGANYIRNTMSSRDKGNLKAFKKLPNGKYDLNNWNPEYWQRFENLLKWTAERKIFVQIELWDQWDHNEKKWNTDPWNPQQNVNYTTSDTQLKGNENYAKVLHYTQIKHDLFLTVPTLNNDKIVLAFQKKFVDKLLSISFQYNHVLYTVTNELFDQHSVEWSLFWMDYVRTKADEAEKKIQITEMFQNPDVRGKYHRPALDKPEKFDFIELSQNSGNDDQNHWENLQWVREYTSDNPRPINHTKTYGWNAWGIERFWRSIIGGAASIRFHRPDSGIGLNPNAEVQIRSTRMLLSEFDIFNAIPDAKSAKLSNRDPDEAYLIYTQGKQYAVYFPSKGNVELDLGEANGLFQLKWLNINKGSWQSSENIEGGQKVLLTTPGENGWVAFITAEN